MTNYRALSLAAAALADSRRVADQHPEKFSADFRAEMHAARDIILHLRGPEQQSSNAQIVPHETNATQQAPVFAPQLTQ